MRLSGAHTLHARDGNHPDFCTLAPLLPSVLLLFSVSDPHRPPPSPLLAFADREKNVSPSRAKMIDQRILEIGPLFDSCSVAASLSNSIRSEEGFWNELPASYTFTLDLHQFQKEEIKVELDERVLQIGIKQIVEGIPNGIRVQDRSVNFCGKIHLPENARVETVKATFNNGVLTVTCDKGRAARRTNVRSVEIE
ncbi:hypothetical protein Taro_021761 [Colocasia esculenta]|uniref:SHSP domain-containing protein n=1 Tax=Colocasia esculenta TaxID=4460 RepID=A0A843V5X1_COLES|nr:hypothetical protein [Colocasia esculenta]